MTKQKKELYQEIETWAKNAILHSLAWSINQLDYSEKSISIVEIIVGELAEKNFNISEEQFNMIVQEYGCYLLLTAQKLYGGEFYWNDELEQL